MAATAPFPGRPFQLRVQGSYSGSDAPNNRSLVAWEIWIDKLSFSPSFSQNPASSWAASVNGGQVGAGGPSGFDFRNGNNFQLGGGSVWVGHNPDGTAPSADLYAWADYELLGFAQAHDYVALPPISGGGSAKGPYIFSGASNPQWRRSIPFVFSASSNPQWRKAIAYVYSGGSGGWRRIV